MEILTSSEGASYVPLHLDTLLLTQPLKCDLYIIKEGRFVLYREAPLPFEEPDQTRLLASGVDRLWIRVSDEEAPSVDSLETILELSDTDLPRRAKAGLLYRSSLTLAKRAVSGNINCEVLEDIDHLVKVTIRQLMRSDLAFHALLSVMRHDRSTFTHEANVAVYALALGQVMGMTDDAALQMLGLGAYLHDAGKARLPQEILNKPGPLSVGEWNLMRQHPEWGRDLVATSHDLPDAVTDVIVQHHERLDGSGYPFGLSGERLHPFSKLVAVVDTYDALTCDRAYRRLQRPYDALSLLKHQTGTKLDSRTFAKLVLMLGRCPVPDSFDALVDVGEVSEPTEETVRPRRDDGDIRGDTIPIASAPPGGADRIR
jgi:HD-GYP domain-containing protein (c-di-GMP phosphodiesterase class II)